MKRIADQIVMQPEPKISRMGFWMDNAVYPKKFIIVDCGYVNHPRSRSNADKLMKVIGVKGRSWLAVVGFGRVLVRVPHAKEELLKRFRSIKTPGGYAWTTHTYDGHGPQFALKHAST